MLQLLKNRTAPSIFMFLVNFETTRSWNNLPRYILYNEVLNYLSNQNYHLTLFVKNIFPDFVDF